MTVRSPGLVAARAGACVARAPSTTEESLLSRSRSRRTRSRRRATARPTTRSSAQVRAVPHPQGRHADRPRPLLRASATTRSSTPTPASIRGCRRSGATILLPTEWVLPCCTYEGVVVNIPEMRLFYYQRSQGEPGHDASSTRIPVGLGRDDWRTPSGKFKVRGKTVNPQWNIPESIRKEHIARARRPSHVHPGRRARTTRSASTASS